MGFYVFFGGVLVVFGDVLVVFSDLDIMYFRWFLMLFQRFMVLWCLGSEPTQPVAFLGNKARALRPLASTP